MRTGPEKKTPYCYDSSCKLFGCFDLRVILRNMIFQNCIIARFVVS